MALVRPFHRYRGEAAISLPEFISILKDLIPRVVPSQSKYRVTEIPTERTIRFYTANGLVDKPGDKRGTSALYGYRQILQVLAVKYLQSHYLPLVKIRSLVENVSNRELEQLIPEVPSAAAAHRAFVRGDTAPVAPQARGASRDSPAPAQAPPPPPPATAEDSPDAWYRIEVAPGIELHVHAVALSADQRERLRGAVLHELGALRGWY